MGLIVECDSAFGSTRQFLHYLIEQDHLINLGGNSPNRRSVTLSFPSKYGQRMRCLTIQRNLVGRYLGKVKKYVAHHVLTIHLSSNSHHGCAEEEHIWLRKTRLSYYHGCWGPHLQAYERKPHTPRTRAKTDTATLGEFRNDILIGFRKQIHFRSSSAIIQATRF